MALWVPYRKGCDLPAHAIKASKYYKADGGPLYIGKSNEGDVGKINADNGKLHNLWISGQHLKIQVFPWTDGGILTCDPRLIEWKEFTKGKPLPSLAFHAGNMPKDGDIYVGKNVAGEVGKINVDGKNMHHLWCATSGCSMSGYILCIHDDPNWASLSGANRGPASGGSFYGGTLCPSSENGQHRFDRVSYKGQVAVDASASSKHEQSKDQSLNLDVSGSVSQGAKSSAQKATKSETEAGGGVSYMGTGVNAYGKKSNENSGSASAEVEQKTTADAGLGMTNRSEQKSEDLAKAGGAIVGDIAASYVCLNCGQQIMCTPTDNAGKIVPRS